MQGNYLYEKVLPLIDYCGDIKKGGGTYHSHFSPNNVRRLYVSPDGAYVKYHVNAGVGLEKHVSFNAQLAGECILCEDYVPMLNVLSADRVCASIEDVVICTIGNNGGELDYRELDFAMLLKGYQSGRDVKAAIASRYKRLDAFIIYDGTITEFLKRTADCSDALKALTDSAFVRENCQVERFHEEWYKGYGSSGQFYNLDREGSPLNEHFKKVIQKREEAKKTEDFERYKKERNAGKLEEFDRRYKQAKQLIRGYTKLRILQRDSGENAALGYQLPQAKFLELGRSDGVEGKPPKLVHVTDAKCKIEDNSEACKSYAMSFYAEMCQSMLESLNKLKSEYPLTFKVLMKEMDRAIKIPPTLEQMNVGFEGARWADSVANMCGVLNVLCCGDNSMDGKEKWLEVIQK